MRKYAHLQAILVLLTIVFPAYSPAEKTPARESLPTVSPNFDIMKVAHRGVKIMAPENTLASTRKAIELGYDYVEVDLRFTRDGVPVLFHDMFMSRKTNWFGVLSWYRFSRIQKLDAGSWFSDEFAGEKIPKLEQVLRVMSGKIKLYLDQKGFIDRSTIDMLRKYEFYPDNIVVVGREKYQRKFLEFEPDAPLMPWLGKAEDVPAVLERYPSAVAFNTSSRSLTREMVVEAHKRGVMVFSNVLRVPKSMERVLMRKVIEYGADAIQFDHPEVFQSVLDEIRGDTRLQVD